MSQEILELKGRVLDLTDALSAAQTQTKQIVALVVETFDLKVETLDDFVKAVKAIPEQSDKPTIAIA